MSVAGEYSRYTSKIAAYLRSVLVGNPVQDIEDVISEAVTAFLNLHEQPKYSCKLPNELDRLAISIAKRRAVDYVRARYRLIRLVPDEEAEQHGPDQAAIREERLIKAQRISARLREITAAGTLEHELVEAVLNHISKQGSFPSLRKIGATIWPHRPQTACEVWVRLVEQIRHEFDED